MCFWFCCGHVAICYLYLKANHTVVIRVTLWPSSSSSVFLFTVKTSVRFFYFAHNTKLLAALIIAKNGNDLEAKSGCYQYHPPVDFVTRHS